MTTTSVPSTATIRTLAQSVNARKIPQAQAALQSRHKICEDDADLKAWVYAASADDISMPINTNGVQGPLAGVPFGVKDIINVAGMPTRCGSPSYHDAPVQFDAACVSLLRAAGAIPVGKTVTAEFAYVTPGATRNPINRDHTPGGSSSGSAAAVAAGMVPFALGTQTGGSVIRPSAFCGIVGFKPSFGRVHRDGVKMTCDSLDTIGWHARSVDDAAIVASVLFPEPEIGNKTETISGLKIAYMSSMPGHEPDSEAMNSLDATETALKRQGAQIERIAALPVFKLLLEAHAVIMTFEFAQSLAPVARHHAAVLSAPLLDAVDRGMKIPTSQYMEMRQVQAETREHWARYFGDADLILTASAPGPAPKGHLSTGSSVFNRNWTLLGWPCLQIPTGVARNGLPLGVQFIGKPNADMQLLSWGKMLEKCVAGTVDEM